VRAALDPATTWLFWNVRERRFDDARVRRALNHAIDRRRVVELPRWRSGEPVLPDLEHHFVYVKDTRHHAQAGLYTWASDFLTGSSFFPRFTCAET
jgi:ABC-type transport system substrate-binding protein